MTWHLAVAVLAGWVALDVLLVCVWSVWHDIVAGRSPCEWEDENDG